MTTKSLKEVILSLPKQSRNIAKKFRRENIIGKKNSLYSCPIAIYLKKQGFTNVNVGITSVTDSNESVRLPKGVTLFINSFDFGRYPDLEY